MSPLARAWLPALLAAQSIAVPSFVVPRIADLTIKTRQTFGGRSARGTIAVLYAKGPRERREYIVQGLPVRAVHQVTITQCDERRMVYLNTETKLYWTSPFETWPERLKHLGPSRQDEPAGAEVTITTDAIDTGERRRVAGYVARRVKTTMTVEPGPGANTRARTQETDGWYIDLRGLGCSDAASGAAYLTNEVVSPGGARDRLHFKALGTARRGYPIEETVRQAETGETEVSRVELVEASDASLDAALFDLPPDYRPALPLVHGGYDLTRPDTLANRLQSYWDELTRWASAFSR
jgi:hypothetical protein